MRSMTELASGGGEAAVGRGHHDGGGHDESSRADGEESTKPILDLLGSAFRMGTLHDITPFRLGECLNASMRAPRVSRMRRRRILRRGAAGRQLTPFRAAP